jgi:AcrR family transcriptional regulator
LTLIDYMSNARISLLAIDGAAGRMTRQSKALDMQRRMPQQARSRDTVEMIFEATARIIEREGQDALNTNHIAERAGISVGTLYQYFPKKEAILIAMARRELAHDRAAVIRAISDAFDAPDAPVARPAVRTLIDLHRQRQKVRGVIMQVHAAHGFSEEHSQPLREVTELLSARSDRVAPGRIGAISPVTLFILTRAIIGVIRAAAQEHSPLLGCAEFEDEIVRLIETYLADLGRSVPPRGTHS